MKKPSSRFWLTIPAILVAASLFAGSITDDRLVGDWNVQTITTNDSTIEASQVGEVITITFRSDGIYLAETENVVISYTWNVVDSEHFQLTADVSGEVNTIAFWFESQYLYLNYTDDTEQITLVLGRSGTAMKE